MEYYTASNVARKATAFPLWRAIHKRWNRNTVSLVSSVTAAIRPSISWISSRLVPGAGGFHCHWQKKMWEAESAPYFTVLFAAALFAAEHASLAMWSVCDSAYVSGTVTSHAMGLSRAQGSNVMPSGRFPSCCMRLTGSLVAGIWALLATITSVIRPTGPRMVSVICSLCFYMDHVVHGWNKLK